MRTHVCVCVYIYVYIYIYIYIYIYMGKNWKTNSKLINSLEVDVEMFQF